MFFWLKSLNSVLQQPVPARPLARCLARIGCPAPVVQHHMRILAEGGYLKCTKEGAFYVPALSQEKLSFMSSLGGSAKAPHVTLRQILPQQAAQLMLAEDTVLSPGSLAASHQHEQGQQTVSFPLSSGLPGVASGGWRTSQAAAARVAPGEAENQAHARAQQSTAASLGDAVGQWFQSFRDSIYHSVARAVGAPQGSLESQARPSTLASLTHEAADPEPSAPPEGAVADLGSALKMQEAVSIEQAPRALERYVRACSAAQVKAIDALLRQAGFKGQLRSHQHDAVLFWLSRELKEFGEHVPIPAHGGAPGGGVRWCDPFNVTSPVGGGWICDDMGLGKTVSVLAGVLCNSYIPPRLPCVGPQHLCQPDFPRTLILVPLALLSHWAEKAADFTMLRPEEVFVYHRSRKTHQATLNDLARKRIVVTTYGTLASQYRRLVHSVQEYRTRERSRARAKRRRGDSMDGGEPIAADRQRETTWRMPHLLGWGRAERQRLELPRQPPARTLQRNVVQVFHRLEMEAAIKHGAAWHASKFESYKPAVEPLGTRPGSRAEPAGTVEPAAAPRPSPPVAGPAVGASDPPLSRERQQELAQAVRHLVSDSDASAGESSGTEVIDLLSDSEETDASDLSDLHLSPSSGAPLQNSDADCSPSHPVGSRGPAPPDPAEGYTPSVDLVHPRHPLLHACPLLVLPWLRVVMDEAHIPARNIASECNAALSSLRAAYKWCVTGTPFNNSFRDLAALMRVSGLTDEKDEKLNGDPQTLLDELDRMECLAEAAAPHVPPGGAGLDLEPVHVGNKSTWISPRKQIPPSTSHSTGKAMQSQCVLPGGVVAPPDERSGNGQPAEEEAVRKVDAAGTPAASTAQAREQLQAVGDTSDEAAAVPSVPAWWSATRFNSDADSIRKWQESYVLRRHKLQPALLDPPLVPKCYHDVRAKLSSVEETSTYALWATMVVDASKVSAALTKMSKFKPAHPLEGEHRLGVMQNVATQVLYFIILARHGKVIDSDQVTAWTRAGELYEEAEAAHSSQAPVPGSSRRRGKRTRDGAQSHASRVREELGFSVAKVNVRNLALVDFLLSLIRQRQITVHCMATLTRGHTLHATPLESRARLLVASSMRRRPCGTWSASMAPQSTPVDPTRAEEGDAAGSWWQGLRRTRLVTGGIEPCMSGCMFTSFSTATSDDDVGIQHVLQTMRLTPEGVQCLGSSGDLPAAGGTLRGDEEWDTLPGTDLPPTLSANLLDAQDDESGEIAGSNAGAKQSFSCGHSVLNRHVATMTRTTLHAARHSPVAATAVLETWRIAARRLLAFLDNMLNPSDRMKASIPMEVLGQSEGGIVRRLPLPTAAAACGAPISQCADIAVEFVPAGHKFVGALDQAQVGSVLGLPGAPALDHFTGPQDATPGAEQAQPAPSLPLLPKSAIRDDGTVSVGSWDCTAAVPAPVPFMGDSFATVACLVMQWPQGYFRLRLPTCRPEDSSTAAWIVGGDGCYQMLSAQAVGEGRVTLHTVTDPRTGSTWESEEAQHPLNAHARASRETSVGGLARQELKEGWDWVIPCSSREEWQVGVEEALLGAAEAQRRRRFRVLADCSYNSRPPTWFTHFNPQATFPQPCPYCRLSIGWNGQGVGRESTKLALLRQTLAQILHVSAEEGVQNPEGHRVVVFSMWSSTLDLAEGVCADLGLRVLRFDGSVPLKERSTVIDTFKDLSQEVHVLLMTYPAGGVGLDLAAVKRPQAFPSAKPYWARLCSRVILLDLWYNAQVEAQAVDRVHRMNQPEQVRVYRIMCNDTLDEHILEAQQKKLGAAAFALDLAESPSVQLRQGSSSHELLDSIVSQLQSMVAMNSDRMKRVFGARAGVWGDRSAHGTVEAAAASEVKPPQQRRRRPRLRRATPPPRTGGQAESSEVVDLLGSSDDEV